MIDNDLLGALFGVYLAPFVVIWLWNLARRLMQ